MPSSDVQCPPIVTTVGALRGSIGHWRRSSQRVALVPTMGALHDGHLDLVRLARAKADRVVVSIFVNPRQFAPHEDFDRYPRDLSADAAKLAAASADLIWAPTVHEMYPQGFATRIEMAGPAEGLETEFRPHFFGGVATVCCKLFSQATPDFAIFGEKDYQQLTVLKHMVRDLDLPLAIIGAPTRREPDGLALSSRNAYLSAAERQQAPALYRAIVETARAVRSGTAIEAATRAARQSIAAAGFRQVDYVAVRDGETLGPLSQPDSRPLRVLAAAWLGKTRLIDNAGG